MSYERLLQQIRSEDSEVRRQSVARAAQLHGEEAVQLLMAGLADLDWRVRKEAVQAFAARSNDELAVRHLVAALHPGDNVGLRNSAVEALGSYGTLAVDALSRELDSLDADGRKLAAEALAHTNQVAAFAPLQRLATDSDPNVKAAAIEAVAIVGQVSPEAALPILEEGLSETDAFQLLVTLDAIRRLGLTPTWSRLRPLLDDPVLVQVGLHLAGRVGQPEAASYFVEHLERTGGQSFFDTLVSFAELIGHSEQAFVASRKALSSLSEETIERLLEACDEPLEPEHCRHALIVLATHGTGRAAPPAIELLNDDRIAAAAHRALELLGEHALPALESHIQHGPALERAACVELLVRLASRDELRVRIVDSLRPLAQDESPTVVRAWLSAVAKLGDEHMFRDAVPWLTGAAPAHVHRAAVSAVRACAQRMPQTALQIAQGVSPESELAAAAAVFIAALERPLFGTPDDDVAFLSAAVSNAHVAVRVVALDALGRFSTERAVDAVAFALNDEAQEVQLAALRSLGKMKDEAGTPLGTSRLLEVAEGRDPTLVVAALQALGDGRDAAALDTLASLVTDPTPWRAVAAVESLGGFEASSRRAGMAKALVHREPEVVKAALEVLAQDESLAEESVVECLSHAAWDVRRLAADLLGRSTSDAARAQLKERLAIEREPLVVEAIRRSLSRFESSSALSRLEPTSSEPNL